MKNFFLLVFALTLMLNLTAGSVRVSEERMLINTEDFTFALNAKMLYLRYKGFSYGPLDQRGLIKTLLDPHSRFSPDVEASMRSKTSDYPGALYKCGGLSFFYSPGVRQVAGISYKWNGFSIASAFFSRDRNAKKIVQSGFMKNSPSQLIFLLLSYESRYVDLGFISSFDLYGNISAYTMMNLSYSGYSVTVKLGNVLPLKQRDTYEIFSFEASIDQEYLKCSWNYILLNEPLYSYSYRRMESSKRVSIRFGSAILSSADEFTFSSKGVAEHIYLMEIQNRNIIFGYLNSSGIYSKFRFGPVDLAFSDSDMAVSIKKNFFSERSHLYLTLSSKNGMSLEITYSF